MAIHAQQVFDKRAAEVRNSAVELISTLKSALIDGAPSLVSVTPSGELNITNVDVNTSPITVRGKTVPAYQAISFTMDSGNGSANGGQGTMYEVIFSITTDEANPQTILVDQVYVHVKG